MSDDYPPLADLREQYREPIDPLDVDAWHTEMEGMRRDVVLPLIDALESARTARDEAQMERSDALVEIERLRDRWRDDVTGQDLVEGNAQLGDEVIRLRAKLAAVEKLADEFTEYEAAQHEFTDIYAEGQRDAWDRAESELRAAIEADRAAGWHFYCEFGDAARENVELRAKLAVVEELAERWESAHWRSPDADKVRSMGSSLRAALATGEEGDDE